jgi:hypothetical protein
MAPVNPSSMPALLVVEGCAACPPWPAHLGASPEEGWAVLEQEEWEALPAFSKRLGEALSRATASVDDGPLVVIFVTSHHWDAVAVAARRRIALDVLAYLAGGAGGSLVLTHGHQRDALCRDGLVALASELSPEWADARVAVSARFDEHARRETRKVSSPSLGAETVAT